MSELRLDNLTINAAKSLGFVFFFSRIEMFEKGMEQDSAKLFLANYNELMRSDQVMSLWAGSGLTKDSPPLATDILM